MGCMDDVARGISSPCSIWLMPCEMGAIKCGACVGHVEACGGVNTCDGSRPERLDEEASRCGFEAMVQYGVVGA